ncbi:hypothetical protein B0H10DRAFT_2062759 [Mycena sp. CBHHK59/15]|nr:hypothetical protein B0H10DRAFT_2062759 [Mycena sp. CBHHK59/15]
MPMDPAIPISVSLGGIVLRIFLMAVQRQSRLRPAFLGIWEGFAVYHGLSTTSDPHLDTFIPCALRLMFDFFFTEDVWTMTVILSSLMLAVVISDVVGSHHGRDVSYQLARVRHSRAKGTRAAAVISDVGSHHGHDVRYQSARVRRSHAQGTHTIKIYEVPDFRDLKRAHFNAGRPVVVESAPVLQTEIMAQENERTDVARRVFNVPPDSDTSRIFARGADTLSISIIPDPVASNSAQEEEKEEGPSMISDPGSPIPEDEPQTPLALPTLLNLPLDVDGDVVEQASYSRDRSPEKEALQSLTAVRDLHPVDDPPVGQGLIYEHDDPLLVAPPLPHDPASGSYFDQAGETVPVADEGSVSEPSSQAETEMSIISDNNAKKIAAKAELLRIQARDADRQKPRLEVELEQAISQHRIKDTFLLRYDIQAAEKRAQRLHERAARRYFRARNPLSKPGEIDVHGLRPREAIHQVETSLYAAFCDGRRELRVIVGRGLHSPAGVPVLRPAIMKEMLKHKIPCRTLLGNDGLLVLTLPS